MRYMPLGLVRYPPAMKNSTISGVVIRVSPFRLSLSLSLYFSAGYSRKNSINFQSQTLARTLPSHAFLRGVAIKPERDGNFRFPAPQLRGHLRDCNYFVSRFFTRKFSLYPPPRRFRHFCARFSFRKIDLIILQPTN